MTTPRERQIEAFHEGERQAGLMSARRRRAEAKCKLVGHRWTFADRDLETYECARCGAYKE